MKKMGGYLGAFVLAITVAVSILSCAGGGGGGGGPVTYTLTFVDRLSGDPVPGVVVYLNGEAKTAGADGKVSASAEGTARLEGYIDPVTLMSLGFYLCDPAFYFYFAFTAGSSVSRTIILEPQPDSPSGTVISGTVSDKEGGGSIGSGSIKVYSSDGREVSGGTVNLTDGTYEGMVFETGNLYFVVTNNYTLEVYYTVVEVSGEGPYNLAYDGTDITLDGNASDTASTVQAMLALGEELIVLNYVNVDSPFSIGVQHRGTDEIRLMARGYESLNTYLRYSGSFTTDASDIDLTFSTGGTVPAEWDSGFYMTDLRTFSWNAAGNANAYRLDISGVGEGGEGYLIAYIEGTSLTIDGSIDLSSIEGATITPIWTEGYLGLPEAGCGFDLQLTPASLISGTTVKYDSITGEWSPPSP